MASDEDYSPSPKRLKQSLPSNLPTIPTSSVVPGAAIKCIICDGCLGPLSERERNRKFTKKGLQTLQKVSQDSHDDASLRIRRLSADELINVKFHESCRASYTHKDRQPSTNMISGRKRDLCENMTTPLLRSVVVPFEIHKHCVICGKGVNMNPLFLHRILQTRHLFVRVLRTPLRSDLIAQWFSIV